MSVAVGDFNGDGNLDLVVANAIDNTVGALLGNGDGTFQAAVNYSAGFVTGHVAVGDFNGDGILDVVTGEVMLLGNGDGTFRPAASYAGSGGAVAVGDFNGDGLLDLAVTAYSSGLVGVLLGHGDGTFGPAVSYGVGTHPSSVAVGDFNGDGIVDLAVANSEPSNTVSVLLGSGDGSLQRAVNYAAGQGPDSIVVADFNGDGVADLAVANFYGTLEDTSNVNVLLGHGDGTFRAAGNYATGPFPTSVAAGDFNSDGIADVAVANSLVGTGTVSVLLSRGDGTFQTANNYAVGAGPGSVAVADFNGDNAPDLVVANGDPTEHTVSVLLGQGDGTFQAAVNYTVGSEPVAVAVGDFNGDGIVDLAVANIGSNNVSVLLGHGDGTFQPAFSYSVGLAPIAVAVGDFDGDGTLDLAVANIRDDNVSILLGHGDGTFRAAVNYAAGRGPTSVAVGDFNGDGLLDLAVANRDSANVSVLLGNGDGSFGAPLNYAAGSEPAPWPWGISTATVPSTSPWPTTALPVTW